LSGWILKIKGCGRLLHHRIEAGAPEPLTPTEVGNPDGRSSSIEIQVEVANRHRRMPSPGTQIPAARFFRLTDAK